MTIKADEHTEGAYGAVAETDILNTTLVQDVDPENLIMNEVVKSMVELERVGIIELVDSDDRPSFIVDLNGDQSLPPIFYNAALKKNNPLRESIHYLSILSPRTEFSSDSAAAKFLQWQRSKHESIGHSNALKYKNLYWVGITIRNRWRVLSAVLTVQNIHVHKGILSIKGDPGSQAGHVRSKLSRSNWDFRDVFKHGDPEPQDDDSMAFLREASDSANSIISQAGSNSHVSIETGLSSADLGCDFKVFDHTVPDSDLVPSDYDSFFHNYDWQSTPLGPIKDWPLDLRNNCNILLSDPRQSALFWGPQRIMLYNDGYSSILGSKHPQMLGHPFAEAWPELAGAFEPAFSRAETSCQSTLMDNACFFIERHSRQEEIYVDVSVFPVPGRDGSVSFYNPVHEVTRQALSERRMSLLFHLGQKISASRSPKDFFPEALAGLEPFDHDVPFVAIYSASIDSDGCSTLTASEKPTISKSWELEGTIGYPPGHPGLLSKLDPVQASTFIPNFTAAIQAADPTYLLVEDGSLPVSFVEGVGSRAFGDSCDAAIILPIRSTGENVLGFLLLGINPRRPYDQDYKLFMHLLSRQLATSMASAVLFEDDTRRARIAAELAALDREELSEQLAIRTEEARTHENRFRSMADGAPVGMFQFDPSGRIIYANEVWYNLTSHPRDVTYAMSWYNVVLEDDFPLLDVEWDKLVNLAIPVSFEIRLRKHFSAEEIIDNEKVEGSTWIIAAAYPEINKQGEVVSILGCLTDISRQKWAENFQSRKMREAMELKRQQENFIDMTSHEMRNPLSAIIQCADFIDTGLSEFAGADANVTLPRELLDSYADSAQTIFLCAQHQKRIIDDVLTLSRLDSNLLLITPVETQPVELLEKALKMFDGELQKSDIELTFRLEESYNLLNVDWVKIDPSRLLQVLINLITNAIKFTRPEPEKKIFVTLGASVERPSNRKDLQYLPRSSMRKEATLTPDWGHGELVYLQIAVQDTGRGLDDHEKKLLFQRFSQASPRTHVQYGGSGLGLFISRELTELQGGEIGVASESGVGSTFAFYLQARRAIPPDDLRGRSPSIPGDMMTLSPITSRTNPPHSATSTPKRKPRLIVNDDSKFVLIVEDNLVNQKVLSKQLRNAGCLVAVANHGLEALAFLEKSRFWKGNNDGHELSVVLMDLEMPIMDGMSCVVKIRKLQASGQLTGHIPVIAVTANARSEQMAKAKAAGMDCVVTKPFRIPELIPEIERLVRAAKDNV